MTTSPDGIILSAKNLAKQFAGFMAVSGVDLDVQRGSIHALIGPNGAGKTTCFNLLTKFLQPTSGTITFNGRDISSMEPADIARLGLIRSFQISAVFPQLTVLENVRVALQRRRGDSFDFWRSEKVLGSLDGEALALIADVGLTEFAHTTAGELSYGRKRALEIATTLALDPEMMLLEPDVGVGDEVPVPSSGASPWLLTVSEMDGRRVARVSDLRPEVAMQEHAGVDLVPGLATV